MKVKWIDLNKKADARGSLIVSQANKNIPFDIKRVYCLYGMNDQPRGFHAHIALQQVAVCLSGACKFLLDDGSEKTTVTLSNPDTGLFIGKGVWREMYDFTPACVLMVLASDYYDESDYIRDYDVFIQRVHQNDS